VIRQLTRAIVPVLFMAGCAGAPPPATTPVGGATPATLPPSVTPSERAAVTDRALVSPSPTAIQSLQQDLIGITREPGVARGVWAIAVHSLDRDERLFELNPRTLLVPASAAKIVAAASAAEAVGWNYRFSTTLRATGSIVDRVLRGDLIVTGNGDPSLGGRGGEDIGVLVDAVLGAGIGRIEGRVIGDDDNVEEPRPQLAWAWDDLGYTTGALFGALNAAENRMTVTVTPGPAAGRPVSLTVEPYAAARPLTNRAVTGPPSSPLLLYPEQRPGEPFLTIAGSIPVGARPASLNVAVGNPTFWFASVLRNQLQRAGVVVTGEAFDIDDVPQPFDRFAGAIVHTRYSPRLAELVEPMLKDSINLYAEAIMRLNALPGSLPTNDSALEGLRTRMQAWGVAPDEQQIIDGSGLSRRDVITAEALLTVLRRTHAADPQSPLITGLPIAGVDGSLANRMRGTAAERKVMAKTGTMSNIRSLAGYVTSADGERLAFVVMVNNFEGTGLAATQAVDRIAVRLAEFVRGGRT
jgi:D-alanyl-D-alanine carboxypeptidase/D-alanyl-D-alanine-endopeptidase (penicillin-binding protein 4)